MPGIFFRDTYSYSEIFERNNQRLQFIFSQQGVGSADDIRVVLSTMGALHIDVDRVQRLARSHEQSISLLSAKNRRSRKPPAAGFARSAHVGCKHMDPIISGTEPAGASPDVSICICANSIGKRRRFHSSVSSRANSLPPLSFWPSTTSRPLCSWRCRIMGLAGLGNIEPLIVWREAKSICLNIAICDHIHLPVLPSTR